MMMAGRIGKGQEKGMGARASRVRDGAIIAVVVVDGPLCVERASSRGRVAVVVGCDQPFEDAPTVMR